jgi:hypothetical protein
MKGNAREVHRVEEQDEPLPSVVRQLSVRELALLYESRLPVRRRLYVPSP